MKLAPVLAAWISTVCACTANVGPEDPGGSQGETFAVETATDSASEGEASVDRVVAQNTVSRSFTAPAGRTIAQVNVNNDQNSRVTVVSYVFTVRTGGTSTSTVNESVDANDYSNVVTAPANCVGVTVTLRGSTTNIRVEPATFTAANASNPNRAVFNVYRQ